MTIRLQSNARQRVFHNSWIVTRCQSLLIIEGLETGIRGREVPGGEIKILGAKVRESALDGGGGYGVIGDGWWGGSLAGRM